MFLLWNMNDVLDVGGLVLLICIESLKVRVSQYMLPSRVTFQEFVLFSNPAAVIAEFECIPVDAPYVERKSVSWMMMLVMSMGVVLLLMAYKGPSVKCKTLPGGMENIPIKWSKLKYTSAKFVS
jgi:hypothetical protein